MNLLALISAGVVVGIFMPLFTQLPVLNSLNCIPCGWIWVGGVIAVVLYRWLAELDKPMVASEALILGIVAGVMASITDLIIYLLLYYNDPLPEPSASVESLLDTIYEVFHLSDMRQASIVLTLLFDLCTYPIISTISSFIGIQLFGKSRSRTVKYQDSNHPYRSNYR
jgi:hypothetical protein